jgi:hypothetical protein
VPKVVYKFRGLVRGNLKVLRRVTTSLLNYHNKHDPGLPTADKFFTDAEIATLVAANDLADALLPEETTR